jgi:hypothetical protein
VLTTEPKESKPIFLEKWTDSIENDNNVSSLLSKFTCIMEIKRTVRELFKLPVTNQEKVKMFFPSTSANYINSRSGGGAIGTLFKEEKDLLTDLRRPGGYLKTVQASKKKMIEVANQSIYGKYYDEEEEISNLNQIITYQDTTELETTFKKLWTRCLIRSEIDEKEANVELVPLAEALKIRVISKGPPLQQIVMKCYQRIMHSRLRENKTFCLIGQPESRDIVQEVLGKDIKDDEVFLSGDFAAATDNLYSWASNAAADELGVCLEMSPIELGIFKRSLTGHNITLQDDFKQEEIFMKKQKRGQLMGSITSFVILCIINAAMGRWAIELAEKRTRKLDQCRMLINGDDIAIKSKQTIYNYWKTISSFVGLEESVGKTYQSREFVNINSRNFYYEKVLTKDFLKRLNGDTILTECNYHETKFINMGLVTGMKRSGGYTGLGGSDTYNDFGARAKDMLKWAPEGTEKQLYQIFIKFNLDDMIKTRLPWYIPKWLGGLGLPIIPDSKHQPSKLDLRIAKMIILNWKIKKPPTISKESPWLMREKVVKKLNLQTEIMNYKEEGNKAYGEVINNETINLLFDSNYSFEDIYQDITDSEKTSKAYKKAAEMWSPSSYGKIVGQGMNLKELEFISRYESINLMISSIGKNKSEIKSKLILSEYKNDFDELKKISIERERRERQLELLD